jgi:hypothetical protein
LVPFIDHFDLIDPETIQEHLTLRVFVIVRLGIILP